MEGEEGSGLSSSPLPAPGSALSLPSPTASPAERSPVAVRSPPSPALSAALARLNRLQHEVDSLNDDRNRLQGELDDALRKVRDLERALEYKETEATLHLSEIGELKGRVELFQKHLLRATGGVPPAGEVMAGEDGPGVEDSTPALPPVDDSKPPDATTLPLPATPSSSPAPQAHPVGAPLGDTCLLLSPYQRLLGAPSPTPRLWSPRTTSGARYVATRGSPPDDIVPQSSVAALQFSPPAARPVPAFVSPPSPPSPPSPMPDAVITPVTEGSLPSTPRLDAPLAPLAVPSLPGVDIPLPLRNHMQEWSEEMAAEREFAVRGGDATDAMKERLRDGHQVIDAWNKWEVSYRHRLEVLADLRTQTPAVAAVSLQRELTRLGALPREAAGLTSLVVTRENLKAQLAALNVEVNSGTQRGPSLATQRQSVARRYGRLTLHLRTKLAQYESAHGGPFAYRGICYADAIRFELELEEINDKAAVYRRAKRTFAKPRKTAPKTRRFSVKRSEQRGMKC